jgi:hypothetical protein
MRDLERLYSDFNFEDFLTDGKFEAFITQLHDEDPAQATALVSKLLAMKNDDTRSMEVRVASAGIRWALRGTSYAATLDTLKRDGLI